MNRHVPSRSLVKLGNLSKPAGVLMEVVRAVRELFRGQEPLCSGFALVGGSAQLQVSRTEEPASTTGFDFDGMSRSPGVPARLWFEGTPRQRLPTA